MKGLASKETHQIIAAATKREERKVPELFWCHNSLSKDKNCCFWHYIFYPNGGPERDGVYHPCYKYETDILKQMDMETPDKQRKKMGKLFCVYKATGLGLTEFVLLWIIYKCFTDEWFSGKEAIIITGPNVDLAQDLIRRTKDFLIKASLPYVDKGAYGCDVNGGLIRCYPSNNIHSARGKPKVSVFFGDESAFFKIRDDSIVRTVGERYIGKSDSWVIWVSTAGESPSGFFYDIMQEHEKETVYKRFHFYVEAGLLQDKKTKTSIFSKEFIDKASEARSFEREYLGIWGSNVGDIFNPEALDQVCSEEYEWRDSDASNNRVIGIDPAYGSSEFAIVITELQQGKKTVIYAESFQRASYLEIVEKVAELGKRFKTKKCFIDSSDPALIRDLRDKYHFNVTGIAFNSYGQKMLNYAADHIDNLNVKIHPMFRKLKQQLMTIKFNKKGLPDKTNQTPFDLGDAFLLAMYYYKMGSGVIAGIG